MAIEHTITIDAAIDTVWALILDIESWPSFTPTITSVERLDDGPLDVGSTARLVQPGQSARVWTVTELEPGRTFAWSARALGSTMTGGHAVERLDDSTTRQTLTISLDGWSAPLLRLLLARPFRTTLAKENAGFKRAAEGA